MPLVDCFSAKNPDLGGPTLALFASGSTWPLFQDGWGWGNHRFPDLLDGAGAALNQLPDHGLATFKTAWIHQLGGLEMEPSLMVKKAVGLITPAFPSLNHSPGPSPTGGVQEQDQVHPHKIRLRHAVFTADLRTGFLQGIRMEVGGQNVSVSLQLEISA